jgi:hypothetical protein
VSTVNGDKVDPTGAAVSVTTGFQPPADMWDLEHPMSFMSLIPERWRQRCMDAHYEAEELFEMGERELYKRLKSDGKEPDAMLNTIRLKLWMEYERCQAGKGRKIEIFKVLGETCRNVNFEKFVLSRADRVAWLLCPPTTYKMKIEEALNFGLSRLREILDADAIEEFTDEDTGRKRVSVNVKLAELQTKIVNMLDNRVHGAARQVISQTTRSMNLNVEATPEMVGRAVEQIGADNLDREIKELERRERLALNLPADPIMIDGEIKESGDAVVDVGDLGSGACQPDIVSG